MREQPAPVSIAESFRGHGRVQSGNSSVEVSQVILNRSKYGPSDRWTFELLARDSTSHDPFGSVLRSYTRAPMLRAQTESGQPLVVPQLAYNRAESNRLTGTAQEVWLGAESASSKPSRQFIVAELTPTRIAIPEKSWLVQSHTGEITTQDGITTTDDPVVLPCAMGKLSFALHYRFEQLDVGSRTSSVRIPTPTLSLAVNDGEVSMSSAQLAERFLDDIEPILRLISFLSRRQVYWKRVSVASHWAREEAQPTHPPEMFERLRGGVEDNREWDNEALVNPYRMKEGLFALAESIKTSPLQRALLLSMLYAVSAQHARFVETRLVNAFTAWESITNGVSGVEGTEKILPSSVFKELRSELHRLLETFITRKGLHAKLTSDLEAKLGELNRHAFATRATALLERYHVPWADLWQPGSDLLACVRQLALRRNDFVHRGDIGNLTLADIDARRALVLVERLLYRILGGDDNWLSPFAYAFVRDLAPLEAAVKTEDGN